MQLASKKQHHSLLVITDHLAVYFLVQNQLDSSQLYVSKFSFIY